MEVKFFVFTKKYNSTLRPTLSDGVSYECVLKSSSSVIAPTLELNYGLLVNPSQYNYCYIEAYGRYYWVQEWTFTQSYWIASLSVDVLATWRPYIGSEDMYVFRSSAEYDGKLIDSKYTTTSDVTYTQVAIDNLKPSGIMTTGYYVVAIFGGNKDSDLYQSNVRYYVFDADNFRLLMNNIYSSLTDGNLFGTIAVGIRNAIYDLSNYIKKCYWSPWNLGDSQISITKLAVGNVNITGFTCHPLQYSDNGYSFSRVANIRIPKHPQASSRGVYCNLKPYSNYSLYFYPFGVIDIDTMELINAEWLNLMLRVDAFTGEGLLRISAFNGDPEGVVTDMHEIAVRVTKYLVEVPITFSSSNVYGVGQNATYEAINRTYASKVATGFLTTIHAISATADIVIPTASTNGNVGSLVELCYNHNTLQATFINIADDDNASNGRPLCKIRKPQNIAGYIEGESNNFSAPATESEMVEVKRFIEQGFYYE